MARSKISGFLVALIMAVVSFLVLFLLLPGTSEKYLGVSVRTDGKEALESVKTGLNEAAQAAGQALSNIDIKETGEGIQNLINNQNGNAGNGN